MVDNVIHIAINMYVDINTHAHTCARTHTYSVILQYYGNKYLSITVMYYDAHTCVYIRHCGHTYTIILTVYM